MTRALLGVLLAVVAAAAAVLSFSALDELGRLCGFASLAWLLPVVLDAGAAAGSLAWLTQPIGPARVFGRRLALALLGSSVGGNAVGHLLTALAVAAPWWLVVAVSAAAPVVLGAVVHLAVLAAQAPSAATELATEDRGGPGWYEDDPAPGPATVKNLIDWMQTEGADAEERAPKIGSGPADGPSPTAEPAPVQAVRPVAVAGPTGGMDELLPDVVRWARERPGPISGRAVRAEFGVGADRARRLLDQLGEAAS